MLSRSIPNFLYDSAPEAAKKLIGWELYVRETDGTLTGGIIIETEAYTADDEASHSFRGKTKRNSAMFEDAGTIYVYFTYGMHWCCNIVTGSPGLGEAVLIRAILPGAGIENMQTRRKVSSQKHLCDGPAKLCQALGISGTDNGERIGASRFELWPPAYPVDPKRIIATPRVGIQRGKDKLWRYSVDLGQTGVESL